MTLRTTTSTSRLTALLTRALNARRLGYRRCANCSCIARSPRFAFGRTYCSTDCAQQWWADA